MNFLLNITTDWITSIGSLVAAFLAGVGVMPLINKFMRDRKIPRKSKAILDNQRRQMEVRPNFELYDSFSAGSKLIKLKNTGSKAAWIFAAATGTAIAPKLIFDKQEAESEEVISIFLGDNFRIHEREMLELHISYQDIDG